jgi:hypothetical protein
VEHCIVVYENPHVWLVGQEEENPWAHMATGCRVASPSSKDNTTLMNSTVDSRNLTHFPRASRSGVTTLLVAGYPLQSTTRSPQTTRGTSTPPPRTPRCMTPFTTCDNPIPRPHYYECVSDTTPHRYLKGYI